jgi:hypothetical protein
VRGGLVLLALLVAPTTAHAGRTFYGWLTDTDVMHERAVEVQNWVDEENHNETANNLSITTWGVSTFIGITDQLELNLPLEVLWFGRPGGPAGTAFVNFGGELRYRIVTTDPEERPAFAPLVRVGARRLIINRDAVEMNAGFSGSFESGIVHVLGDVNFIGTVDDDSAFAIRAGAGVSIEVYDEVRVGAEVFSNISLEEPQMPDAPKNWVVAGPNASWTHGRFWLSASYGVGIMNIGTAPRLVWGVAF